MIETYLLSVWEAMELLENVLIKHFTEIGKDAIVRELQSPENYTYLVKHSDYNISDDIAPKLKASYNAIPKPPKRTPKNQAEEQTSKKPTANFSKLVYTIGQNIKKGIETHLNDKQIEALLNYINQFEKKGEYRHRQTFDPKYPIRNGLKGSNWVVYTWDYSLSKTGEKIPGVRRSILNFTNQFRVKLITYRNRDNEEITYIGDYILVADYIKIRFSPTVNSKSREEDLSFLFYVKQGNIKLALGQYRSLDCGSLLSGTAIMQLMEKSEVDYIKADFTDNPIENNVSELIVDYLSEQNRNYIKSPEKITSLGKLNEWSIAQRKKSN